MERTSPSSDLTGLFNVGRQSIRRLAHAVKKRKESAAGEASDAPVRAPTENTAAASKRKSNSRFKKTPKKYAFPTFTREQEQSTFLLMVQPTAAVEREVDRQGVTTRRRSSSRKSSRPAASTTNGRSLVSWPFKRSQGRLDIQGRPLHHASPSLTKAAKGGKRDKRGSTSSNAGKTNTEETCGRDTRQEGPTTASREQQVSRNTSGGGDEESAQRRFKKRRRRSYSDADGYPPAKASRQTHVVAAGLATPRRPRMKEKDQRCTPKKLNVKEEEFLSLKKKLEWELTLGLYYRQKKEFMEINKDMYE